MKRLTPCRLVVLAALIVGLASGLVLAQGVVRDHLQCYEIKDTFAPGSFSATLVNQFGTEVCDLKVPADLFCVETEKSRVEPPLPQSGPGGTPAGDFLCYEIKHCQGKLPADKLVEDQFGRRVIKFKKVSMLCAPARKIECGTCLLFGECTDIPCSATQPCPDPNEYCIPERCPAECLCCPVCGDGVCEGDETICNCVVDCAGGATCGGVCLDYVPVCGNGSCERCASPGESYENCPQDCPLDCSDCRKRCCICPGMTQCLPPGECPLAIPECRLGPACKNERPCLEKACEIQSPLCNAAPCLNSRGKKGECTQAAGACVCE